MDPLLVSWCDVLLEVFLCSYMRKLKSVSMEGILSVSIAHTYFSRNVYSPLLVSTGL